MRWQVSFAPVEKWTYVYLSKLSRPDAGLQGEKTGRVRQCGKIFCRRFWLIMNFAAQFSMRLTMHGESIEALLAGSWASIATDLISVPAAILAIMLVWGIDANQTARHGEIVGVEPATMASPFAFNL